MATSQSFSSNGEEAIQRPIELNEQLLATPDPIRESEAFNAFYETERTVRFIEEGDYKRIALQFPDELLHDSVPVYNALKERVVGRELYVLADTSYGSCCVDEVAASHVSADAMVHYGHACLSQTSRLPVIYVFGRRPLDVKFCVESISQYVLGDQNEVKDIENIVLKHDVMYAHSADELVAALRPLIGHIQLIFAPIPNFTLPVRTSGPQGSTTNLPDKHHLSDKTLTIWIGEDSPTLTKLLMTSTGTNIVSYSPMSGVIRPQTQLTNKLLMRRYAILQKARDADVFGILVGTLGVASYLPLIGHIRSMIAKARKKSYTVSVGKINSAKLGNFMEVECWVWVSCSEGMVDSKEYLRPIISPYELELALQRESSWTGKYTFDFEQLLTSVPDLDQEEDTADGDRPSFSLVTGTFRKAKQFGADNKGLPEIVDENQGTISLRTKDNALTKMSDSAAAIFLQERTYRGLDPRLGKDEPSVLEQGRSGIAGTYKDVDRIV